MRVDGVAAPEPGRAVRVMADGIPIAVFNLGGELVAVDAKCTHVGGPLERGTVEGNTVTCPWHRSQFDLKTGAVVRGPAIAPVRAYRVRVAGGGLDLDPV